MRAIAARIESTAKAISVRPMLATVGLALLALPTTALAEFKPSAELRSACMGDVFKFCSSEIPSVAKVTACMKANGAKLSPACKATANSKG